jgi:hypothetical protein
VLIIDVLVVSEVRFRKDLEWRTKRGKEDNQREDQVGFHEGGWLKLIQD